ncbi:MAG: cation:proton antiporter [Thermodesulfobacteriota bacterium]
MIQQIFHNPGLCIGIALAAGMACQSAAYHMRLPGIVLLLCAGVLLGPDVAGVVQPSSLGGALTVLTGFAVAVILFEGGMNLKLSRLRRESRAIRQLVLAGGVVTVLGGAAAARLIMGWGWKPAFLFGTLVMVTGPTVVNPLMRRIRAKRNLAVILEAEGVFIDAIGAVVATVALEAALSPAHATFAALGLHVAERLAFGAAIGLFGGLFLVGLMRYPRVVPEGTENVFTLTMVLALFQASNALVSESGIAAVTMAGIVVGNTHTHIRRELAEFKEQLTVMLIGMLFVLLAADVRVSQVSSLGWPGIITVCFLIVVVRPLTVLAGTYGTSLALKEKVFLAWMGPRGIVAAAVASLFAAEFSRSGMAGGIELRALVFTVILASVVLCGLTGGAVARTLGLARPRESGWVILGANELARAVAKLLREDGSEVVSIEANPNAARDAEKDCTRVIFGNGLKVRNLLRAEIDTRAGALALTPNVEVNLLFVQHVRREAKLPRLLLAFYDPHAGITPQMAEAVGAHMAFGAPKDVDLWALQIRKGQVKLARFLYGDRLKAAPADNARPKVLSTNAAIALAFRRQGRMWPVSDRTRFKPGDELAVLVRSDQWDKVLPPMLESGWTLSEEPGDGAFTLSLCSLPTD